MKTLYKIMHVYTAPGKPYVRLSVCIFAYLIRIAHAYEEKRSLSPMLKITVHEVSEDAHYYTIVLL
jgi:hypothetical protein